MKTTTEYNAKLEALKGYLVEAENFTEEEANEAYYDDRFDCFCCGSWEYRVFTDEEADQAAREEILGSLWAFRAQFVLSHTEFYRHSTDREDLEFIASVEGLQSRLCESANSIIKALILDLDEFVQDAIDEDGRGQFLAQYDGEEIEIGEFFAYRQN